DLPPCFAGIEEAPLHAEQRVAESRTRSARVLVREDPRHFVLELHARPDAVVDVEQRLLGLRARRPVRAGSGDVDLPVAFARGARVVGDHRRAALSMRHAGESDAQQQRSEERESLHEGYTARASSLTNIVTCWCLPISFGKRTAAATATSRSFDCA